MDSILIQRISRCGRLPQLPQYQSAQAAARDVQAFLPEGAVTLAPGERRRIPTGLRMAIPQGWAGYLLPRSGLSLRNGITLSNSVGLIDSDYRGEVQVALSNLSDTPFTVEDGDRIAQLMLLPAPQFFWEETDTLPETARGEGGFGSTGLSPANESI